MAKTNAKGRGKSEPLHARLYDVLVHSPAYRSLSPYARSLYTELKLLYRPGHNGETYLSVRRAADLLGTVQLTQGGEDNGKPVEPRVGAPIAKATAEKAFGELLSRGFIKMAKAGTFNWKQGKATTWILTEYPIGDALATKDYRDWTPGPIAPRARRLAPHERKSRSHQTDGLAHQTDGLSHGTDRAASNGPMGRVTLEDPGVQPDPSDRTHIVYQDGKDTALHSATVLRFLCEAA